MESTSFVSIPRIVVKPLWANPYTSNFSSSRRDYVKGRRVSRGKRGECSSQVLNSSAEGEKRWRMGFDELKSALGQRVNLSGIGHAIRIVFKERNLAIPHALVPDIRRIDWIELKNKGFEGVIFDKDNTITAPYSLTLWPTLESSMATCKSAFGDNIGIFSNSAGLLEYDPDGVKAKAVEDAIGINVIRHCDKKPVGTADEIERHFRCESSRLIMVGDRIFTDIVYGNRNGFFTILTDPLSLAGEPLIVRQVRLVEMRFLKQWLKQGLKPPHHKLISDPEKCVTDH